MDKEKLLALMDEEARLRRHVTSLIEAKWRLINMLGDEDICMMLIKVVTALNKAENEYDAIYYELQSIIKEETGK